MSLTFWAIIQSKINHNFASIGKILLHSVKVFDSGKMFITFERMLAQQLWQLATRIFEKLKHPELQKIINLRLLI